MHDIKCIILVIICFLLIGCSTRDDNITVNSLNNTDESDLLKNDINQQKDTIEKQQTIINKQIEEIDKQTEIIEKQSHKISELEDKINMQNILKKKKR